MNCIQKKAELVPLPASWVDRIFEKLTVTYGRDFTARWDGMGEKGLIAAKQDWAWELGGFVDHGEAIGHALAHLPAKPPNVIEFRALARLAPAPMLKLLESPRADLERVAGLVQQIKSAVQATKQDPKAWAHKLKRRHESGERLGTHQINAYRQALGLEGHQPWQ